MKAETLRDLISGKHPPTAAVWLSKPSLLRVQPQHREPRPGHGGDMEGAWGGWADAVPSGQRGCRLFLSWATVHCHLLTPGTEKHTSIPTVEQLLMESEVERGRPLFQFHFTRLRRVLPRMKSR